MAYKLIESDITGRRSVRHLVAQATAPPLARTRFRQQPHRNVNAPLAQACSRLMGDNGGWTDPVTG